LLEFFFSAENGVSSVAADIEQLNLQTDEQETESEEDNSDVLIPNHLQLHTPECFSLSFGSFGAKQNAAVSGAGTHASRPINSNLEETSGATDVSAIGSSDAKYVLRKWDALLHILVIHSFYLSTCVIFLAEILTIMGMSILLLLQVVI
jgi:hypothetical protein